MPQLASATDTLIVVMLGAFLLGTIPFGLVLARLFGLGDLRRIGSGNIGATNVLRTGHRGVALATLLLDGGKGAAAVLLARALTGAEDAAQLAGLAAFLGHLYPPWLGFRGGKGVATFLGVMLALAWPAGLACCATWALAAALTRMSSAAALIAAATSAVWLWVFAEGRMLIVTVLMTLLIYIRHAPNLARIKAGTEPRIGGGGDGGRRRR